MTATLIHAEDCDLDEDCSCDPRPPNRLRDKSAGSQSKRKACTVAGCDEPADLTLERHASLPSTRYCRKHHRQADRWLAEERRLDHIEDGRREWLLEWENGWDEAQPGGSATPNWAWDDAVELSEGEVR